MAGGGDMGRPKLDKTKSASAAQGEWRVAVYLRLSREDGGEESESVVNQKKILAQYLNHAFGGQYAVNGYYVDDGLSGTDDSRESFMRMIQDIEAGKVNCVLCKSLSRAFRNYSDQGYYLEYYFPRKNVRFISTGDPKIDTYTHPEAITGLEVPITGLMNDRFAAKTSSEIRRTFDAKRRAGEFIGAFPPYGYLKDPRDKNHLVPDGEIVPVKREMMRWLLHESMSLAGIARRLNERGIPNPTAYKHSRGWQYRNPKSHVNDGLWSGTAVRRALLDQVNLGHMVQGKQRVVSYKIHDKVAVPEDEWYIVKDTHEPTFSPEEYDAIHRVLRRDTRTPDGARSVHLFSGFMRCQDCGKALRRKSSRGNAYYVCRTNDEKSKTRCGRHSIRTDMLEAAILAAIQSQITLAGPLAELVDQVSKAPATGAQSDHVEKTLREKSRELAKTQAIADGLYFDRKSGMISMADYERLKAKCGAQLRQLGEAVGHLETQRQQMAREAGSENEAFATFKKYRNIQTLERALLIELVDTIYVHEGKALTVVFRFSDGMMD